MHICVSSPRYNIPHQEGSLTSSYGEGKGLEQCQHLIPLIFKIHWASSSEFVFLFLFPFPFFFCRFLSAFIFLFPLPFFTLCVHSVRGKGRNSRSKWVTEEVESKVTLSPVEAWPHFQR
uniref:Uncharacterized protein n=1 Tax=Trypanosoma vivax (strain Y486) TaxID=1055687 RepID=G0U4R2_TRYVY|nr:hypothetical protein TVY486_1014690 [Trypanosoma vivax Y486]